MTRTPDPAARQVSDESAALLGSLASDLDGSVSRSDELAARERFVVAVSRRRPKVTSRVLLAALACALAVGLAVWLVPRAERLDYDVSGPAIAQGPWLEVPVDRTAVALRFSEGTEIELGPGSRGRVADVTADGARVVLGGGALHARVVHRKSARWVVDAGPYAIEVTGTAFDVGWTAAGERLELSLHDGSVIVRGPSLHDGIRVAAGQRLVANARTGGAELSSLFQPEAAADKTVLSPSTPTEPAEPPAREPKSAPARGAPSWSELVSVGNFRAVLDAAKARGIEQSVSHGSLRDLVALSDAARYAGDRGLAQRGLLAQRSRFPSSTEARAAAFVLGRVADDQGSLGEAQRWYEQYLGEAPSGSFAAEALGRKLVVLVRRGETAAAHQTAQSYLKRFPRGAHAPYAQEVLQGP